MKIGLIECFIIDSDHNVCRIETKTSPLQIEMYWSYSPAHVDFENYVGAFKHNTFKFKRVVSPNKRIYYHLRINQDATFVTGERILAIDGMCNFRDLGGYPTQDGRRVKWGLLYRGDQLFNSKESSDALMENLKIKTIIDLRNDQEVLKSPNRCLNLTAKTYQYDPNAPIAAFAGEVQNRDIFSDRNGLIETAKKWLQTGKSGDEVMINQQREFVLSLESQHAFKDSLMLVMDYSNAPLFQHCRGGKDRTGYLSMLELMVLGVDRRYVLNDYLITNRARAQKNKAYRDKFMSMTDSLEYTTFYMALFEAKAAYLNAAIDLICADYGDVEHYVMSQFGISEAVINQFKDFYLES